MQRGSLDNHLFRSEWSLIVSHIVIICTILAIIHNFKCIVCEKCPIVPLPYVMLILKYSFYVFILFILYVGCNRVEGNSRQTLSWAMRMKIAVHAARGLSYLHTCQRPIIYRDFKSANILLDNVSLYHS